MYVVVPDSGTPAQADIWHALADPTRRGLIDRLAAGPRTTSELCAGWPMSRFGVMKHLGVLERAGVVTTRRQGRIRLNYLNVAPLHAVQSRWLSARASGIGAAIQSFSSRNEESAMTGPNEREHVTVVEIALDWEIEAPVQTVWRRLFDEPEAWWPADFRAGPPGAEMRFDEKVAGSLREERPDGGGVLWYTVLALHPMQSIDLSGQLAARYGGPATSLLHIELLPGLQDGCTLFRLTDSAFGRLGPQFRNSAASGWQEIFGRAFKGHCEGGR
jgi:DNA-binding transcriptional ArsR family regulator